MEIFFFSMIAGFFCAAFVMPLIRSSFYKRYPRLPGTLFSVLIFLQMLLGVIVLANVLKIFNMPMVNSELETLRIVTGFLAGISARIFLSNFYEIVPRENAPKDIHAADADSPAPNPAPTAHSQAGLLLLLLPTAALVAAGLFAPHLESYLTRLSTFSIPGLEFAVTSPATQGVAAQFAMEKEAQRFAPYNFSRIQLLKAALERDENISKIFLDSQERAFESTYEQARIFFDTYFIPVSSCLQVASDDFRNKMYTLNRIETFTVAFDKVVGDLQRINADFSGRNQPDAVLTSSFDNSMQRLHKEVNGTVSRVNESFSYATSARLGASSSLDYEKNCYVAREIARGAMSDPKKVVMNLDSFNKAFQNPYVIMGYAMFHAALGDSSAAAEILNENFERFANQSPNYLVDLSYYMQYRGDYYESYLKVVEYTIKALEDRLKLLDEGKIYKFKKTPSICNNDKEGLNFYGGALILLLQEKNRYVYRIATEMQTPDYVPKELIAKARSHSTDLKAFVGKLGEYDCMIRERLAPKSDANVLKASYLDSVAVFSLQDDINNNKLSRARLQELRNLFEEAYEAAENSRATDPQDPDARTRERRLIRGHIASVERILRVAQ